MKDVGLLPDLARPPVERALIYIAERLRHDADLAYLCGPGTGTHDVLKDACAAIGRELVLSAGESRLECRDDEDEENENEEPMAHDSQEEEDIADLREALQELVACAEVEPKGREVGSDLWTAIHRARMALERTA